MKRLEELSVGLGLAMINLLFMVLECVSTCVVHKTRNAIVLSKTIETESKKNSDAGYLDTEIARNSVLIDLLRNLKERKR